MTTTGVPRDVIVVGVDGSEPSLMALRWAMSLAELMRCDVQAVMAWHQFVSVGFSGMGMGAIGDWDPQTLASQILNSAVDGVCGTDRPANVSCVVTEGVPAKVLLDAAADARMLVVGSRGHGGFTGLLLGSVSGACAEHGTCPVLVIHGTTPAPATGASL